jgi:hypothetical protein
MRWAISGMSTSPALAPDIIPRFLQESLLFLTRNHLSEGTVRGALSKHQRNGHCPRCHGRLCHLTQIDTATCRICGTEFREFLCAIMCHSFSTIFACLPFRSGISSSRASALGNNFAGSVHKISVPTPGTQPHQQRMLTKELYNVLHMYQKLSKHHKVCNLKIAPLAFTQRKAQLLCSRKSRLGSGQCP